MVNEPVITINKLSKQYSGSRVYALKDLSIQVSKGEVYGFLGPNGAGKSTTIRILLNFLQPTSGSATMLGKDVVADSVAIKKSLGYLSGDFKAYDKMTGRQFLKYMQDLQPPKRKGLAAELAKTFNISLSKRIGSLSKGNRQKIGIIQAFMHEPEIIILDEPTDGLDPLMQEAFYKLVHDTKQHGTTFFISSHNLSEVRKICDRVAIIKDGKLVRQSTISELADKTKHTLVITFADKPPTGLLRKISGVKVVPRDATTLLLHVHGSLSPVLKELAMHTIIHLATQEISLEDKFMQYYETKG